MKIVIKIPDHILKKVKEHYVNPYEVDEICEAILSGTPLPEHHGDLIDRNELLDESYQIDSMYCAYDEVVKVDDIKNAPTIIEADKEGDSE